MALSKQVATPLLRLDVPTIKDSFNDRDVNTILTQLDRIKNLLTQVAGYRIIVSALPTPNVIRYMQTSQNIIDPVSFVYLVEHYNVYKYSCDCHQLRERRCRPARSRVWRWPVETKEIHVTSRNRTKHRRYSKRTCVTLSRASIFHTCPSYSPIYAFCTLPIIVQGNMTPHSRHSVF